MKRYKNSSQGRRSRSNVTNFQSLLVFFVVHIPTKIHRFPTGSFKDFVQTDAQIPLKTIPARSTHAGKHAVETSQTVISSTRNWTTHRMLCCSARMSFCIAACFSLATMFNHVRSIRNLKFREWNRTAFLSSICEICLHCHQTIQMVNNWLRSLNRVCKLWPFGGIEMWGLLGFHTTLAT